MVINNKKKTMPRVDSFNDFVNEGSKFPHEIKSESYWKKILYGNDYALDVLNTIMTKQDGFASNKQMQILKRAQSGDKTPYSTNY
jgi:hypothetical protein